VTVLPMLGDYFTNQLLSGTTGTAMFGNVIDDQLNSSGGIFEGEGAVFSLLFLLVLVAPMIYYVVATNRSARAAT
jgi:ABC-type spermidine/putrescine transport system permease subunit I